METKSNFKAANLLFDILYISTMAKTETIDPKNVDASVAINFT